jgi:glutathione peroxidase
LKGKKILIQINFLEGSKTMGIYQITVEDSHNEKVLLEKYKGKVLLIVNTATNCIFTPQYTALQGLYDKFKDKGLEILDFPCNQFANQAPGTQEEIEKFCSKNYSTTFPRFSKIKVNGPDENLLYTYLKRAQKGFIKPALKWNFTKFLISRDGKVIKRYGPAIKPEQIETDLLKVL